MASSTSSTFSKIASCTVRRFAASSTHFMLETLADHHFRFVALSHNTVIGAAGSSILNAEAAVLKGYM